MGPWEIVPSIRGLRRCTTPSTAQNKVEVTSSGLNNASFPMSRNNKELMMVSVKRNPILRDAPEAICQSTLWLALIQTEDLLIPVRGLPCEGQERPLNAERTSHVWETRRCCRWKISDMGRMLSLHLVHSTWGMSAKTSQQTLLGLFNPESEFV